MQMSTIAAHEIAFQQFMSTFDDQAKRVKSQMILPVREILDRFDGPRDWGQLFSEGGYTRWIINMVIKTMVDINHEIIFNARQSKQASGQGEVSNLVEADLLIHLRKELQSYMRFISNKDSYIIDSIIPKQVLGYDLIIEVTYLKIY